MATLKNGNFVDYIRELEKEHLSTNVLLKDQVSAQSSPSSLSAVQQSIAKKQGRIKRKIEKAVGRSQAATPQEAYRKIEASGSQPAGQGQGAYGIPPPEAAYVPSRGVLNASAILVSILACAAISLAFGITNPFGIGVMYLVIFAFLYNLIYAGRNRNKQT